MTYGEEEAVAALKALYARSGVEINDDNARQQWRGMCDPEKELVEYHHKQGVNQ